VVVLIATFAVASIVGRHSVIDTAWGPLFGAVAIVAFIRSAGYGHAARRWLLLVLPVVWGVRLAVHIGRRTVGRPEDPRYVALLAKARGNRQLYALRMMYLLQGARVLEAHLADRPGWKEYAARTPAFRPRPPRRT
jgi:steroid 5-alpha reductase family enzyme